MRSLRERNNRKPLIRSGDRYLARTTTELRATESGPAVPTRRSQYHAVDHRECTDHARDDHGRLEWDLEECTGRGHRYERERNHREEEIVAGNPSTHTGSEKDVSHSH